MSTARAAQVTGLESQFSRMIKERRCIAIQKLETTSAKDTVPMSRKFRKYEIKGKAVNRGAEVKCQKDREVHSKRQRLPGAPCWAAVDRMRDAPEERPALGGYTDARPRISTC